MFEVNYVLVKEDLIRCAVFVNHLAALKESAFTPRTTNPS